MAKDTVFESWRYTLAPDKEFKWFPENALQLTGNILSAMKSALFSIEAHTGLAQTRVRSVGSQVGCLEPALFQNVYPTIYVKAEQKIALPLGYDVPVYMIRVPFKTWQTADRPILYVDEIRAETDPLSTLYQAFNALQGEESAVFNLFVHKQGRPLFHKADAAHTVLRNVTEESDRKTYARRKSSHEQVREGKILDAWYECFITLDIYAFSTERVVDLAQVIIPTLENFKRDILGEPANGLTVHAKDIDVIRLEDDDEIVSESILGLLYGYLNDDDWAKRYLNGFKTFLSHREIAALWHIPHKDFTAVNVEWPPNIPQAPSKLVDNSEGALFGGAYHNWEMKPTRLLDRDRAHHINILGRNGTGKSTLMHNLIREDIVAGKGVCVIDPHGKLITDILRSSIPVEREDDVLLLDFAQNDYPVPLNIFATDAKYTAIGRIVDMVEAMAKDNPTGVRTEKYLREAIKILQFHPNATMFDVMSLFQDTEFRLNLLDKLPKSAITIRTFWGNSTTITSQNNTIRFMSRS